ncbi:hypothetical protein B0I72DRAFT_92196 [Yarrowia lipolytica]|jgi:protein phosphatase inhibitor 2|uniref:YALI0F02233p n=2 Tax=Yarrowia lipolytica TaxID=4952 RepID=Q6C366_YARLI|nr:YALI0F02233p [Yarrowia lipolytica CLIB122]AOW06531.1 hypothetical protein YALI1_F03461g [Yarrowia lipolytica]KAB8282153.1 hypothetical protein BKA91DRAFT_25917 [Yarrowia lipolytica]KAE8171988.1 hypothetical protein BKA90DRAFT_138085 [Yarrowia lipolytica]KAJ8056220.1 hypothetical protein LXG23DRAFT_35849 [Yarrowia lipolytica]QNQ00492.1 Hypothetical protein YALI2_F00037g [Yarrowia lipolytica]|eukprot:XP_504896.1 YALI0F02233p [Yarrowia lipolytica CLIB122]
MVKGILKHKTPEAEVAPNPEIDRQKVLENTRANAQLYSQNSEKIRRASTGKVRVDEASSGTTEFPSNVNGPNGGQPSDISWDEAGIYLHEQDKGTYMKIDEPKTPYAGTLGDNEYYAEDDEEATGFSLGEPEFDEDGTLEKERIIKDSSVEEDDDDHEIDEREQLREEDQQQHEEFLKKRNQHYNMKIDLAAARKLAEQEDDEDDE